MSDLNEWLKERRTIHNAATEGPWYKTPNDRILSESVQWPEGDDYDVAGGLGRDGAVVEAIHDFDGNAIADAHNTLPALLTAAENVLEAIAQIDREYSKAPGENAYADGMCDAAYMFDKALSEAIEGAIK